MTGYLDILRAPGAARLAAGVVLGGLALAYAPLGLVLFVQAETGSYATAGGVLAGYAIGRAVATPPQGRLLDRLGPRAVLVPCTIVHAVAIGALLAGGLSAWPAAALITAGAVAGAAYPALPAVLRVLWPQLVGRAEGRLRAAYALDALLGETLFLGGIVAGGALAALASPAAALAAMTAAVVAGTALFVTTRGVRWPGDGAPQSLLGALGVATVRVLVACSLPVGVAYGVFEVVAVAFAGEGDAATATVLFVIVGLGSAAGGMWYGASQAPSHRVLVAGLVTLVPALGVAAISTSFAPMAVAALLIGLPYAPVAAATGRLLIDHALAGTQTEAFTWVTTTLFVGGAAGSALAGAVIDAEGVRAAALTGAAATLVLVVALSVSLARAGVREPETPARPSTVV